MAQFIIRRILVMIPTLFVTSLVAFVIIQLPPGDYLTSYIANLSASGEQVEEHVIEALNERFGLDQPMHVQYLKWITNIITKGDFGQSFAWRTPVEDLIWGRLSLTVLISLATLIFTWIIAFPVGIYSAVNKYSLGDYIATFFGFLGLAIPNFLLALVLMYIAFKYFNQSVGGLFSPEYVDAPWSIEKILDLMGHLWIPMVILGTAGAASLIRIMRANLLDELSKPYVRTARAKGLPEWKVILKYPVRVALNPFVSTAGWLLPTLVSGSIIVATVLSLPTTGPMLLSALTTQDMYLAGAFILLLS
ncbi:MAG: ABC transporter permease, partial [Anaerolineae bacterium]|nr:ABC transporter permease [Anaerolineae bacterium]